MIFRLSVIIYFLFQFLLSQKSYSQTLLAEFRDVTNFWGYVDTSGKVIIPAEYMGVTPFSPEGIALVKDYRIGTWKYIDINNNTINLKFKIQEFHEFIGGLAAVKIHDKWGYINNQGELQIPPVFKLVKDFHEGRAWVTDLNNNFQLIDKSGQLINLSGYKIKDCKDFSEGLAAINIDDLWGFIDYNGKIIIKNVFLKTGEFADSLCWARNIDQLTGFIDHTGKYVIEPEFTGCDRFDTISHLARVKDNDGIYFYIDKKGMRLYFKTDFYNDFVEGLCHANYIKTGKAGFVDKSGYYIIPPKFDKAADFKNGVCRVRVDGKWGLIDKTGRFIIEPKFDFLDSFYKVE